VAEEGILQFPHSGGVEDNKVVVQKQWQNVERILEIKFGYCSLVVSNITSLEIRQRKNIKM